MGKRTKGPWPLTPCSPDSPHPPLATLWRWLDRAVACGLARRDGKGTRTDPFRYWLPEQDFPDDPLLAMLEESGGKEGERRSAG